METFKTSALLVLLSKGWLCWVEKNPKEVLFVYSLFVGMIRNCFVHLKDPDDHHGGLEAAAARPHPHLHPQILDFLDSRFGCHLLIVSFLPSSPIIQYSLPFPYVSPLLLQASLLPNLPPRWSFEN